MMRADDGCIDHLQSRVTHSASSECLQDHIPQAAVGPPTELTKDRIPIAKFLRQIAPGRAGSHQPRHRVEHAAMIARWSATTPYQERFEIRPLIVGHRSANHGRSPQRAALNQFAIPASIDWPTRLGYSGPGRGGAVTSTQLHHAKGRDPVRLPMAGASRSLGHRAFSHNTLGYSAP